jgi:hypothetical protein
MADENTQQQPTTRQRLDAIMKSLEGGAAAQAAAAPGQDNTPTAVEVAGGDDGSLAQKEARVGASALSKSFLRLARASKAFHHLGADRVLEDPKGYLRSKKLDTQGRPTLEYQVSDFDLEVMIQSGLSQKAADAEGLTDSLAKDLLKKGAQEGMFGAQGNVIQRALDVASGGVLVRTDVEPLLYEAYLREFPALERIRPIRANGIRHTYNVRTAIPQAKTLNDIGDFSGAFSNSTIGQEQSTRIAILAAPVAIALKLAAAVRQSGMVSFNLEGSENLEVVGAMTALARKKQALLFQGNSSTAAKTLNDEEGLYNALDFDGLRTKLKGAGTSRTMAEGETLRGLIKRAAIEIRNAGGQARNIVVFLSGFAEDTLDGELEQFFRIVGGRPGGGVDMNLSANGLKLTGKYVSEIVSVPADAQDSGIGHYTFGGNPTEDMYVTDTTGIKFPWLISPTPTIIELPLGFDLKLARTFVPIEMSGLQVDVANFHRKIRIARQS